MVANHLKYEDWKGLTPKLNAISAINCWLQSCQSHKDRETAACNNSYSVTRCCCPLALPGPLSVVFMAC